MKKKDVIFPQWGLALFSFGIAAFLILIDPDNAHGTVYVRSHVPGGIAGGIIFGCLSLRSYVLNQTGVICRWLFIPYRKVKWEKIEKIMVVPDNVSHSILCILRGCSRPNFSKNERYDTNWASYHAEYTLVLHSAKKYIHIVEKYWPGEIENKAILYMKKE